MNPLPFSLESSILPLSHCPPSNICIMCVMKTSQGDTSIKHTKHVFYRYLKLFINRPYSLNPLCPKFIFRLAIISKNWISKFRGASIADQFCYLCFVLVMFSCLFVVAMWSPAGKGLTSWLSCVHGWKFKISKILNFRKSEFKTYCMPPKYQKFNGQIPLDKLKLNQKTIITCRIQHFEADFLWNPENPEFRKNPENFHPCVCDVLLCFCYFPM